jgi:hypothetical protein
MDGPATASADNKVILWHLTDPARPRLLGQPLSDHRQRFGGVHLVTLSLDRRPEPPPTSARPSHARRGRHRNLLADFISELVPASSVSAESVNITCLPSPDRASKTRTWYVPPRFRIPVKFCGPCLLQASACARSGQLIGQRSTEDHYRRPFALFREVARGGVELSTFRFSVQSPPGRSSTTWHFTCRSYVVQEAPEVLGELELLDSSLGTARWHVRRSPGRLGLRRYM